MLLSDIGEGSNALICSTDRTQCCSRLCSELCSGWKFPNGSFVNSGSAMDTDNDEDTDTDNDRTRNCRTIHLNRRRTLELTGIFTCRILTSQSEINACIYLYIGVYDDAGEGVLGMHCLLCMSHYISTIRFTHCITVL